MRTLEIATNSLASKLKTKQSKQNKNQPQMRKANKLDTFSLTINNTRIVYSRNNQWKVSSEYVIADNADNFHHSYYSYMIQIWWSRMTPNGEHQ